VATVTGISPVLLVSDLGRSVAYHIRVDDVESVYAEVQARGAGIDYTIYDAPSGFREFGVQDPDGYDIAFGQPLE
jgi:hypothetical protein